VTPRASAALTELELEILLFERSWWKHPGAKQAAVRERFGLSSTRYHQIVNALLDQPEALEVDPVLINRLRRQREARVSRRVIWRTVGRLTTP
jgi:hypothetical protein